MMESPFEHLIGVNYVPTEQEVGIISQLLVEPYHELDRIDGDILGMERRLSELRMRRNCLWTSIDAHRGMISCARRLPNDVLQEVFARTLPTSFLPGMSSKQAPVVLTHVCRRWRELALANPHLWAGIHVQPLARYGDSSKEDRQRKLAAIGVWTARARAVPISVSFESDDDISLVTSALQKAAPLLKWNGFGATVTLDDTRANNSFLTMVEDYFDTTPLKTAQRISLDIIQRHRHPDDSKLREILAVLKLCSNRRLRSLTLRYVSRSGQALDIAAFIPPSLVYLDLGTREEHINTSIDMASFTKILAHCPNLEVMKTSLDMTRAGGDIGADIVHTCMQEILLSLRHVADLKDGYIIARLISIIFPSLRASHLQFEFISNPFCGGVIQPGPTTLSQTLRAASVTSLTIHPLSLLEEHLILVLGGLLGLVQLHLLEVPRHVAIAQLYGPDLIHFLSPPQLSDTLEDDHGCPKLQYLKLEYNSSTIDGTVLPGLLHGRQLPMRQCHIHFRWTKDSTPREDLEDFADLIAAGLNLELRYGDPIAGSKIRDNRRFTQVDKLVYGWDAE